MINRRLATTVATGATLCLIAGCGGSVGTNAGGAGGQVYTGNTGLAATVDVYFPGKGKNEPVGAPLWTLEGLFARNTLNRLRKRVNAPAVHLIEPLTVAAALHTGYMLAQSNRDIVFLESDPENPFRTYRDPAQRLIAAVAAYNVYNTPLSLPDDQFTSPYIGVNGQPLPSDADVNPDFSLVEFTERYYPDRRELDFVPGTVNDQNPPVGAPNTLFQVATLETWNLVYGRLAMMRDDYTALGIAGRISLADNNAAFQGSLWPRFEGDIEDPRGSMLPSYAPSIFGGPQFDRARAVIAQATDNPNMITMCHGAEAGIARRLSAWPSNGETGTWLGYHPVWDIRQPRLPSKSLDRPYGIPVHYVHPTARSWTGMSGRLAVTIIGAGGDADDVGDLPTYIIYGGTAVNTGANTLIQDDTLRAGEVMLVANDWLNFDTTHSVYLELRSSTETVTRNWSFKTSQTFSIGYDSFRGPFRRPRGTIFFFGQPVDGSAPPQDEIVIPRSISPVRAVPAAAP
jgi:hypothetical protein